MSNKEPWYKGWWLIPLIAILLFAAWKAYPLLKSSEIAQKLMKR